VYNPRSGSGLLIFVSFICHYSSIVVVWSRWKLPSSRVRSSCVSRVLVCESYWVVLCRQLNGVLYKEGMCTMTLSIHPPSSHSPSLPFPYLYPCTKHWLYSSQDGSCLCVCVCVRYDVDIFISIRITWILLSYCLMRYCRPTCAHVITPIDS